MNIIDVFLYMWVIPSIISILLSLIYILKLKRDDTIRKIKGSSTRVLTKGFILLLLLISLLPVGNCTLIVIYISEMQIFKNVIISINKYLSSSVVD